MRKVFAFILSVIILSLFASCGGKNDKFYTTEDGNQYIVVRDDNGNIVINESGKLQVYTLNENGKKQKSESDQYITEYIDFNGQVVSGRNVETAELKFEIPAKFTDDINIPGYFYYEPYDSEIFFTYYNDNLEKEIEAAKNNCESLLESFGSEVFEYNIYTIDVNGTECTAIRQDCTSSELYRSIYNYYIPYDSGFYNINCVINTDHTNKIDFDKFVEKIIIK